MTILILAVLVIPAAATLTIVYHHHRDQRRWRADEARIAGYGERRAAASSRPYGDVIAVTTIRRPDGEPFTAGRYYDGERGDLREF